MLHFDLETRNLINLFSQTPEMFCLLAGPEHLFTFVNEAHIKVLGFDATGKKVREAQPESVEVHGILDNVYNTGKTAHLRRIAVTVGTSLRYFDLTYAARKNEEGQSTGIMILGSEITESVVNELKVRESEEKLKLALDSANMGLWHFDLINNIVTTSDSLSEILGVLEINGDIGKVSDAVVHPEDRIQVEEAWMKAIEEKSHYAKEFRIIKPSGEIRWLSSSGSGKYDEEGRAVSMSGVSLDITDMKKTEERLKDALRFKDDFLSVASHELKTPLTSLKLQIQTSLRKLDKEGFDLKKEMNTLLNKNHSQVNRLVRLVDDMLDLSRIQSGRLSFSFRKENLHEIIMDSHHLFKDQFDLLEVPLTLELPASPSMGIVDRERIEQVMTNLLTNALKYGKNRPVAIKVKKIEDHVVVAVIDQGRGIATDHYEKVFKKFERAVTPSEVSGLGLGLYISREIVEAHGGKIWIESELDKGSTFFVQLPLTE